VYNDHLTSASSTDPFQTLQQNSSILNVSANLDAKGLLHDFFQEVTRRGAFQLVYPALHHGGGRDTH
jgi:hypothetical protein